MSDLIRSKEYMKPVINWINKNGSVAFSFTKRIEKEFDGTYIEKINELRDLGKLKNVDDRMVDNESKILEKLNLESDDPHLLALAKVANVKVMITKDQKLRNDFKKQLKGKIYQNKKHKKLLDLCVCK